MSWERTNKYYADLLIILEIYIINQAERHNIPFGDPARVVAIGADKWTADGRLSWSS